MVASSSCCEAAVRSPAAAAAFPDASKAPTLGCESIVPFAWFSAFAKNKHNTQDGRRQETKGRGDNPSEG